MGVQTIEITNNAAAMSSKVTKYTQRFDQLKGVKQDWEPQFQEIAQNIFIRKADFMNTLNTIATNGKFLTEDLFDTSAFEALDRLSNTLLSDVWDKGPRSVKVNPPEDMREKPISKEVKEFYNRLNVKKNQVMGNNEARLEVALSESTMDECGFGTTGIAIMENEEDDVVPIKYKSWDIKTMYIDEGEDGIVDTLHVLRNTTVRKMVIKYGLRAVHPNVQKLYNEEKYTDQLQVLEIIEPRKITVASGKRRTNKQKPYASIHIDYTNKFMLKESGFDEFPVVVSRFTKLTDETWGRCPSFLAMPTVRDINILAESIIRAQEKMLDPTLGVLDDGSLGRGTIDTSAGAINTVRYNSRLSNQKPIFEIGSVHDLPSAYQRLKDMIDQVAAFYKLDRLLDMSSDVQMSASEAVIRDGKSAKGCFSIYNRQESEKLTPLVEKTLNIIIKRGLAGVEKGSDLEYRVYTSKGKEPVYLPDEILRRIKTGEELYELQYLTPARRKRDVEEAQAIMSANNEVIKLAQIDPSYIDYYDMDGAVKELIYKVGVPLHLLRDDETVKAIREGRAQQSQQMQQIEMADKAADIGVKNAQTMAVRNKAMKGNI
jgi:hypothetical protein